ncbi:ADP-ribosyltransferase domain-containing protein [Parachlamydia acanthamoebae]|uniref:ADP-ribosyltransferase domain-containing protein n=1 Tax=Parachlamydia acanthamoebae TaxID=83552 RepID=UPI000751A38E|nr:ADP-ribosyltransferase domain-containing protein [Parachlamydia acanthamoebae]
MMSISLQTPACIDAFKKVARSIKINPENHLYLELSDSVHASGDKKNSLGFTQIRKLFEDLHKNKQLNFKEAKSLQKSFAIISKSFSTTKKEGLIKKIRRKWLSFLARRSIRKVPSPLQFAQIYSDLKKIKPKSFEKLTKSEYIALKFYSNLHFKQINCLLREDSVQNKEMKFVIKSMKDALVKLPKKSECLYRGVAFPKQISLNIRDVYSDKAFLSFSKKKKMAQTFLNRDEEQKVLFKIKKSQHAKSISGISILKKEKEHLYLPEQQFRIVKIKTDKEVTFKYHKVSYTKVILQEI